MLVTSPARQKVQRESRELRSVLVSAVDSSELSVSLTAFAVAVAFARRNARPTAWVAAAWVGPSEETIEGRTAYEAEYEVGGSTSGADHALAPGLWDGFIRITTVAEAVVLAFGELEVE